MTNDGAPAMFGETVRELRLGQGLGLRKLARIVELSSGYLSKMETGQFDPPGEAKVVRLAETLGQDPDGFLALAGKVRSDLPPIILQHPQETSALLRAIDGLSTQDIVSLTLAAQERGAPAHVGQLVPLVERSA